VVLGLYNIDGSPVRIRANCCVRPTVLSLCITSFGKLALGIVHEGRWIVLVQSSINHLEREGDSRVVLKFFLG